MNTKILSKIILAALLVLCLTVSVCACGNTKANETPTESPSATESATELATETFTDTETETESETVAEPETPEEPEIPAGYKVTVVDENGSPLAGVFVQICNGDICLPPYFTAEDGTVTVNGDISAYTVKVTLDGYVNDEEHSFEEGSNTLTITMAQQ